MAKLPQKRLDQLLVEKGLVPDIRAAQALIMAGRVRVVPQPASLKPGSLIAPDSDISITNISKYVSRGGDKLEAALDFWGIPVKNDVCLDVGSSTGGFTDCLLQRGAKMVYAVDVGKGQADPKIRGNPNVRLFEETHFLRWEPVWKSEGPRLAVVDVSFISLRKILPRLKEILPAGCGVLALIKPQFEVGPKDLVKGIVRDGSARGQAIQNILLAAEELHFSLLGSIPCPVLGAKGNEEEWFRLSV